ncbi:hypothetical protein CCP3SC1AL1_30054 [Gammaproteobacteria bacterium]
MSHSLKQNYDRIHPVTPPGIRDLQKDTRVPTYARAIRTTSECTS